MWAGVGALLLAGGAGFTAHQLTLSVTALNGTWLETRRAARAVATPMSILAAVVAVQCLPAWLRTGLVHPRTAIAQK